MDEITEVENEISLLRGEVHVLRRQLERVCQALDETRRRVGLSNIIDDATLLSYIWGYGDTLDSVARTLGLSRALAGHLNHRFQVACYPIDPVRNVVLLPGFPCTDWQGVYRKVVRQDPNCVGNMVVWNSYSLSFRATSSPLKNLSPRR